jgi:hypothetical protein
MSTSPVRLPPVSASVGASAKSLLLTAIESFKKNAPATAKVDPMFLQAVNDLPNRRLWSWLPENMRTVLQQAITLAQAREDAR